MRLLFLALRLTASAHTQMLASITGSVSYPNCAAARAAWAALLALGQPGYGKYLDGDRIGCE